MAQNLVIVESPAKAKTIEKILGKDFLVKSSFGHVRDLAKKDLSVDIDNHFAPLYEISDDKKTVVRELKKLAAEAQTVWLASDEDREGEAIAWHLYHVLGLDPQHTKRIVFHEITKEAILHAVENPREIDLSLVNAQQARRVLDRLVGFELSPVLWKKIKPALSAGRVQSVAVRLIAEREKEILNFNRTDYYRIVGTFQNQGTKPAPFQAELEQKLPDSLTAEKFLEVCREAHFTVSRLEKKPGKRSPAAPFTTSTLQQEANRKLSMSVSQVMSVAQRLYEAGWITYMRTDSVNLSNQALGAIKAQVTEKFGEAYLKIRKYKTKTKGAQEAHEAIRPTYPDRKNIEGTAQEKRLYDLIWKRTVASQMADAILEKTTAEIAISTLPEHHFTATGEVIRFDGFLKLYSESTEEDSHNEREPNDDMLPPLNLGDTISRIEIIATQRFTSPNARYSEASLVKRLEELGIGRPSTYAPTISTIINRGYVIKESREGTKRSYDQLLLSSDKITQKNLSETFGTEKNKLFPTDIGLIVNDYLEEHFDSIVDYNFTANVEKEFDKIAAGGVSWNAMIENFYKKFHPTIQQALEDRNRKSPTRDLGVDQQSGLTVYAKIGRFGPYVQLGENETEGSAKPRYANLASGQLIASITLAEALKLFEIPRNVGDFEGKTMMIGIGRFGPYVRHDGKFISLKKTDNPYTITGERAQELIAEKRVTDAQKHIKCFENDPETEILQGRWGPYIVHKGGNYKIPKEITDPHTIDYEKCMEIVSQQEPTGKGRFGAKKGASAAIRATTTKAKTAPKKNPKTTAKTAPKTTPKATSKRASVAAKTTAKSTDNSKILPKTSVKSAAKPTVKPAVKPAAKATGKLKKTQENK